MVKLTRVGDEHIWSSNNDEPLKRFVIKSEEIYGSNTIYFISPNNKGFIVIKSIPTFWDGSPATDDIVRNIWEYKIADDGSIETNVARTSQPHSRTDVELLYIQMRVAS